MSQSFRAQETPIFERLWIQQEGVCALCGGPMLRNRFQAPHARIWARERATLDHIWPKSKGGKDTAENLQLAHAHCNKVKGNHV